MTPAPLDPPSNPPALPPSPFVLRGHRVVTPDGVRPASLHISGTRITRVGPFEEVHPAAELIDAGDALVMPGLVDSHVHVNEPGRTEWEGFATATKAAAAGGVTTLCDMPLNSLPATTTVVALEEKRRAAHAGDGITLEFIGGVVPGNTTDLEPLATAGVCAFKCFLAPSGVPEFPPVDEHDLREALPVLARTGRTLMVHAEDPALLHSRVGSRRYTDYLASRPEAAERSAIALLIRLLEWCPTPVHVVHLSSAASLDLIRGARVRGFPLTVETCPHYLTFAAEEIPDGAVQYKCAPPVRTAVERDALWQALAAGDIDLVASDHSPCPPALKGTGGDFFAAWGGIASLELGLAAVWTGARARGLPPERLARWMSAAPARLVGLAGRKGSLAPGYDADLVVWEPEWSWVVDPAALHQRHKVTPYAGRELYGRVRATWAGGRLAFGSL